MSNGVSTQLESGNNGQTPVAAQDPSAAGSTSSSDASVSTPAETQVTGSVDVQHQDASNDKDRPDSHVHDQAGEPTPSTQAPMSPSGDQDGVVPANTVSGESTAIDRDSSSAETDSEKAAATTLEETMQDATPQEETNVTPTTAEDDTAMEEALEHVMEEAMKQEAMLEDSAGGETPASLSVLSSPNDGADETRMEVDSEEAKSSSPSQSGEAYETPYETPAVVETDGGDEGDEGDEDDVMVDTPPEDNAQPASSEAEAVESEEE